MLHSPPHNGSNCNFEDFGDVDETFETAPESENEENVQQVLVHLKKSKTRVMMKKRLQLHQ